MEEVLVRNQRCFLFSANAPGRSPRRVQSAIARRAQTDAFSSSPQHPALHLHHIFTAPHRTAPHRQITALSLAFRRQLTISRRAGLYHGRQRRTSIPRRHGFFLTHHHTRVSSRSWGSRRSSRHTCGQIAPQEYEAAERQTVGQGTSCWALNWKTSSPGVDARVPVLSNLLWRLARLIADRKEFGGRPTFDAKGRVTSHARRIGRLASRRR